MRDREEKEGGRIPVLTLSSICSIGGRKASANSCTEVGSQPDSVSEREGHMDSHWFAGVEVGRSKEGLGVEGTGEGRAGDGPGESEVNERLDWVGSLFFLF